jgi:hypothetical protein
VSAEDKATPDTTSKSGDGSSILIWLAKYGPSWARIPAIIAGILIAAVPTLLLLNNAVERWVFHSADDADSGQLQMAAAADATGQSVLLRALLNKPNLSEDDKKELAQRVGEMDHEVGHLSNPKDDVKWTVFEKTTKKDYFGYKLFPSDKCLLIARIEDGKVATTQWLRDPNHPTAKESATSAGSPLGPSFSEALTTRLVDLSNPFQARLLFAVDRQRSDLKPTLDQKQEAQGECLNPHPWPYQELWGGYVNRCQQPVFRQWNDGCRHVQMFDHCTNAWGPVVWQICVPNHHP